MFGLVTITPPAVEPVSLARAKAHLRIDHDEEDDLITGWIRAARELSEQYTGKRWVTQTLRLTLARWPDDGTSDIAGAIRLPVEPVASVDTVRYFDAAGTEQALDAEDYQTWLEHSPPLVCPPPDGYWPALKRGKVKPVTIEFTAGGPLQNVPAGVSVAMLLAIGNWDENRGDSGAAKSLPPAAKAQLDLLWNGAYS